MNIISIKDLHDHQWQQYFSFFNQIALRYMPRDWMMDWQTFKERRLINLEVLPSWEKVIYDQNQPVAWIRMEKVSGRAFFDWNTSLSPLPLRLVEIIKHALANFMDWQSVENIATETGNTCMNELAPLIGAEVINRRYFFEFHHDQADFTEIASRVKAFEKENPNIQFHLYKDRPDEILAEYIDLYNLVSLSIPRSDLDGEAYKSWPADKLQKLNESNRKTGNTTYTGVLKNELGKIIGLTDLNINTRQTDRMYQGMTGINPDYRKKGFGEWLKLAMLLQVRGNFPNFQIIDTDSNALNIAMHKLNGKIGFKKTAKGGEYEIPRHIL